MQETIARFFFADCTSSGVDGYFSITSAVDTASLCFEERLEVEEWLVDVVSAPFAVLGVVS